MKTELTTAEHGARLNARAVKKLATAAGGKWQSAMAKAKTGGRLLLEAVNDLAAAGRMLEEATGNQQLVFTQWGIQFYIGIKKHLPPRMTLEQAQWCLQMARAVPEPLQTFEEAKQYSQIVLIASGQLARPHRPERQLAQSHDPWNEFQSKALSFAHDLPRLLEAEPMAGWDEAKLATFIRNTEPVAEQYNEALRLAAAKAPRQ